MQGQTQKRNANDLIAIAKAHRRWAWHGHLLSHLTLHIDAKLTSVSTQHRAK